MFKVDNWHLNGAGDYNSSDDNFTRTKADDPRRFKFGNDLSLKVAISHPITILCIYKDPMGQFDVNRWKGIG